MFRHLIHNRRGNIFPIESPSFYNLLEVCSSSTVLTLKRLRNEKDDVVAKEYNTYNKCRDREGNFSSKRTVPESSQLEA